MGFFCILYVGKLLQCNFRYMRPTILILLIIFAYVACNTPVSDSTTVGNETVTDSVNVWLNWVRDSAAMTKTQKSNLLQKAYVLSLNSSDKAYKTESLAKISYQSLLINDSLNFRAANAALLEAAKATGNHKAHGLAHWDLADFHKNKSPDSAYYQYREAYIQFSKADLEGTHRDYPARMLYAMANTKEKSKDYVGAEQDAIKAIELFEEFDSKEYLFTSYDLLGIIQNGLEKFDKALEYHLKSQTYIKSIAPNKRYEYRTRTTNNIASTYLRSKNYGKASEMFNSLKQEDSLYFKNPRLYAQVLASSAYSDFKNGSTDYTNLRDQITKSTTILDSLDNRYFQARNHQFIAEILASRGDLVQAVQSGLQAIEIAKETQNNDRLLSSLKLLTTLDKRNSTAHAKAYFNLSEKLHLEERTIQDKFARIQMETDQIIEKNESLAKRTQLLAGISIGLLVICIGIFVIISQRISNQRLKFNQKQQESNQEIYSLMLAQHGKMEEGKKSEQKRVSEELHDGILGQMLGIRLVLSGLNERDDPSAIEQRAELIVKLQELEEEIRTISHELSAAAYKKVHNFILSIKDLVKTVQQSSDIAIHFEYADTFDWDGLDSDIKINTYRITQELLQNSVKHAKCKNIRVAFLKNKNLLHLTIQDDGIGFGKSKGKRGIGLKNINSRVEKMGATFAIESEPSMGTTVNIKIPNIDLKQRHPKPKTIRTTVADAQFIDKG